MSMSTELVASSISRTWDLLKSALAMQISCRWPTENESPNSATDASSPPSSERIFASRWTRSSTVQSSCSLAAPRGSRLNLTSPEKRTGSCGMMLIRLRRFLRLIWLMSTPSI